MVMSHPVVLFTHNHVSGKFFRVRVGIARLPLPAPPPRPPPKPPPPPSAKDADGPGLPRSPEENIRTAEIK